MRKSMQRRVRREAAPQYLIVRIKGTEAVPPELERFRWNEGEPAGGREWVFRGDTVVIGESVSLQVFPRRKGCVPRELRERYADRGRGGWFVSAVVGDHGNFYSLLYKAAEEATA